MSKVALVQFKADTDKNKNLERILSYIKKTAARGAKLCALPEFMMFYTPSSQSARELAELAETINGEFVSAIANCANENSIQVLGTFYEKSRKKNRVYDTAFLMNKKGKVTCTYKKIHLYDALGVKESNKLQPGSRIEVPTQTSIGKIGMMICYDLRFPEMSRTLASSGSEIIFAPSAWVNGSMKEEHWLTLNKTRAIENGCYIIAPDQVGNIFCGRSLAVDPYGKIMLDMKKREGIGIVDVFIERVKEIRKGLPLLKNRRTDLYSDFKI